MEQTAGSTSWTEDLERKPAPAPGGVALGRVIGAHGLRGELRIRLLDSNEDNLRAAPSVRLAREQGDPKTVEARVRAVGSGRRGEARLALEGIEGREAAEALRGAWVLVDAAHLGELRKGEYYQYQLVGCRVEDGEGRLLGVVTEIWETGAPDVLVVVPETREGRKGPDLLVPAADEILRSVDVEARRIVIEPPPGLLDGSTDTETERETDDG